MNAPSEFVEGLVKSVDKALTTRFLKHHKET
jgi:hypothetical protein